MKSIALLLSLSCLLSTAHAQTAPAKSQAARAYATVATNGKAIGRAFKEKSKPTDMRVPVPVPPVKK